MCTLHAILLSMKNSAKMSNIMTRTIWLN